MGNRRLIITFALVFAAVFSLFYYAMFHMLDVEETETQRTLYLNQVGIFEESGTAQKICDQLQEHQLSAYQVEKEGRITVVTSIYAEEEKTEQEGKTIEEMGMNYLTKKITVEGSELVQAVDDGDYVRVLQAVDDEDTGD